MDARGGTIGKNNMGSLSYIQQRLVQKFWEQHPIFIRSCYPNPRCEKETKQTHKALNEV